MMKNTLKLSLAAVMLLSFVACGYGDRHHDRPNSTTTVKVDSMAKTIAVDSGKTDTKDTTKKKLKQVKPL
jgi:hypothetical protein